MVHFLEVFLFANFDASSSVLMIHVVQCCRIRGQVIHMLVDTSHPLSRGALLHDVFQTYQEQPDQRALQRLMIRSILLISLVVKVGSAATAYMWLIVRVYTHTCIHTYAVFVP